MATQADRDKFHKIDTVIFDMDGVITGEAEYWSAADHTVLELLYSKQFTGLIDDTMLSVLHKSGAPVAFEHFVSPAFIALLRNNGINTNWDLAYFSFALYLIELMAESQPRRDAGALFEKPFAPETLSVFGAMLPERRMSLEKMDSLGAYFMSFVRKRMKEAAANGGADDPAKRAVAFVGHVNAWRLERTGLSAPEFERRGPMWDLVVALFQERYLGDLLYLKDNDSRISAIPKLGTIQYEVPVIPLGGILSGLSLLKEAGMKFGIATGRPYDEIMIPLKSWGLYHFFDPRHISTHREIHEAEKHLSEQGRPASIAKPHPYVYLRAIHPDASIDELLEMPLPLPKELGERTLIVGDSLSDLIAARTMGARSAVVLTGIKSLEAVEQMRALDPDFILEDVSRFEDLF